MSGEKLDETVKMDNSKIEEILKKELTLETQRELFDVLKDSQLLMPVTYSDNLFKDIENVKPGDVIEPEGHVGFNINYITDEDGKKAVPLFTGDNVMEEIGLKTSAMAIYMSDLAGMLLQTDKYELVTINPFTAHDVIIPIHAFLDLFNGSGEDIEFQKTVDMILELLKKHSVELEENTTLFLRSDENIMIDGAEDGLFVSEFPIAVSSSPESMKDLKYTNILLMPKSKKILPTDPQMDLDIIIAPETEFYLQDRQDEFTSLWMCEAQPFYDKI